MRRRRREVDKRLDWRDPDMPVLTLVKYTHRFLPPKRIMEQVTPERMSQFSRQTLEAFTPLAPNWRNDPTYNLAKRQRRQ